MLSAAKAFVRRTLIWYDPLPVTADGKHDALMAPTAEEAAARAARLSFPPDFFFGASTAAYQIEGGLHSCNWSMWEKQGTRADGKPTVEEKVGRACDSWNLFAADLAALKRLGTTMYRFSVEWSRVEPSEGCFDEAALDKYLSWCVQLRAEGIEPMVTLHHFTEPAWFCEKGGWEVRANVDHFERFCKVVAARLSPACSYWTTINELNATRSAAGWPRCTLQARLTTLARCSKLSGTCSSPTREHTTRFVRRAPHAAAAALSAALWAALRRPPSAWGSTTCGMYQTPGGIWLR